MENIQPHEKVFSGTAEPESHGIENNESDDGRDETIYGACDEKRSANVVVGSSDETHDGYLIF